tara:strand:- start:397 stop:798 length:402 start_codon:yes stop_codon:yes gene_type:complete
MPAKSEKTVTVVNTQEPDSVPFAACPVDNALRLVSGKWKPRILYRLSLGTQRFGELKRSIPGVTQRILTLQLRELEHDGLVHREVYAEVPPKVEYSLTPAAVSIGQVLMKFGEWFEEYSKDLNSAKEQNQKAG